jgi:hypothetical protein
MHNATSTLRAARDAKRRSKVTHTGPSQAALNEQELADRWGISVKTLRRWRQEQLGPVFRKLGARVIYLLTDVEAFERRSARYGTGTPVSA